MSLLVHKYGGTSVGSAERICAVADHLVAASVAGNRLAVVLSAMSGETSRLQELAASVCAEPKGDELDVLLASGEQVSIALLSMALRARGVAARSYLAHQLPIATDSNHNKALICGIDTTAIQADLAADRIAVVAGFQGRNDDNRVTTLGRGGSDISAVALAVALGADECRIFTDVDGVRTIDPRVDANSRKLSFINYETMLELSCQGARVLHARSVSFAARYNMPLRVMSSFTDGSGTLIAGTNNTTTGSQMDSKANPIHSASQSREQAVELSELGEVSGIALTRDIAQLKILGVPDMPGSAAKVLQPISAAGINVDVIVQDTAEDGSTALTFTVSRADAERAETLLQQAASKLDAAATRCDKTVAKVSLVGMSMTSHSGVATRMFQALADESINIRLISTSEIKISVVLEEKYLELAARVLHSAFQLDKVADLAL